MNQIGVPTDYGQYTVLVAVIVGLCAGFTVAVKWLDNRRKEEIRPLEERIAQLEAHVTQQDSAKAKARRSLVMALALLPAGADFKQVQDKLLEACDALA